VQAILRTGRAGDLVYVSPREGESCKPVAEAMRAHSPYGQTSLRVGSWVDLENTAAIVIALDREGTSAERASLLRQVVRSLDSEAPDAVLIVATEPVDVLTTIAARTSRRPPERVFGTGTCAESVEVQRRIANHYDVSQASVYAMVVGHHGGAAVPLWNRVLIGGHQIIRGTVLGKSFDRESMWDAFERGCASASEVSGDSEARTFETCLVRCLQAVTADQRDVLPVSTLLTGEIGLRDVALALPCVVGSGGVRGRIMPDFSNEEETAFRKAADEVYTALSHLAAHAGEDEA
jgi:L-lactate dehydrogenase